MYETLFVGFLEPEFLTKKLTKTFLCVQGLGPEKCSHLKDLEKNVTTKDLAS